MSSRDLSHLLTAATLLNTAADQLGSMAGALDNLGSREHLRRLAEMLHEEQLQLFSMADADGTAARENTAKVKQELEGVDADNLFAVYDQRLITERGEIKWYNPHTSINDYTGSTRATKKRGICFHHTAVHGGFGVHSSRVNAWLQRHPSWVNSPDVWTPEVQTMSSLVRTVWPVPPGGNLWDALSLAERREAWARAMALADRYRGYRPSAGNGGVPYHVVSAANSVLYLNLPFDWVTWHGNGSNAWFLGFGWDAHSGTDPLNIADMGNDIEFVIKTGRDEGHFADGIEFTCHCAWTNKPTDPGREFIAMLAELADEFGAVIKLDFKSDVGARSLREVLAA